LLINVVYVLFSLSKSNFGGSPYTVEERRSSILYAIGILLLCACAYGFLRYKLKLSITFSSSVGIAVFVGCAMLVVKIKQGKDAEKQVKKLEQMVIAQQTNTETFKQ
jgi:undecaprenyl pyrophosphate phosphatase UppP